MAEIYRDRSDGAAARREELLRRRRAELVTLPHAVRRVVVARGSRITAGAVATLGGVVLLATAWSPGVERWAAGRLPGLDPAALATLLLAGWIAALLAWGWSRARAEHRFAVAMSRYVLPSADLDHDVERLDHERPDRGARQLAHQQEVRSAAWPILGAAVLVPATALWIVTIVRARGWAVTELDNGLARHARELALTGAIGAIGAIASTRRALRQPVVTTIAAPIALLAAAGVITLAALDGPWMLAWALAGLGGTAAALAASAWVLARERARLAIDDPAAGSELFTLRGAWRALHGGLTAARAVLVRVRPRYWAMLASAAMVSIGIGLALRPESSTISWVDPPSTGPAFAAATPVAEPAAVPAREVPLDPWTGEAERPPAARAAGDGVPTTFVRHGMYFDLETQLDASGARTLSLPDLPAVPYGWRAVVSVELLGEGQVGLLREDDERITLASGRRQRADVEIHACQDPRPFTVRLHEPSRPNAVIRLRVSPVLALVDCAGLRR